MRWIWWKNTPVAQCFIEYDEAYKSLWWEIGLDINEKVILKMSDERNYGYWLDTNMQFEDFMKQTGCQMVSRE